MIKWCVVFVVVLTSFFQISNSWARGTENTNTWILGKKNGTLHDAIWTRNLKEVKKLIKEKADVNGLALGTSPINLALRGDGPLDENRLEILKLLLKHPKLSINQADTSDLTAFQMFLSRLKTGIDIKIARKLIKRGANFHVVDDDGKNILHWAVKRGNKDLIRFLLEERQLDRGEVNAKDGEGNTPLDYASIDIKLLLQLLFEQNGYNNFHIMSSASLMGVKYLKEQPPFQDRRDKSDKSEKSERSEKEDSSQSKNSPKTKKRLSNFLPAFPLIHSPGSMNLNLSDKSASAYEKSAPKPSPVQVLLQWLRDEVLSDPENTKRETYLRQDTPAVQAIADHLAKSPEYKGLQTSLEAVVKIFIKHPQLCVLDELVLSEHPGVKPPIERTLSSNSLSPKSLLATGRSSSFNERLQHFRLRIPGSPKGSPKDSPSDSPKENSREHSPKGTQKDGSSKSPRSESPALNPNLITMDRRVLHCERAVTSLLQNVAVLMHSASPSFKELFRGIEQVTNDVFPGDPEFTKNMVLSFLFLRYINPNLIGVATLLTPDLRKPTVRTVKTIQRFVDRGDEGKEPHMEPLMNLIKTQQGEITFVETGEEALDIIYQTLTAKEADAQSLLQPILP